MRRRSFCSKDGMETGEESRSCRSSIGKNDRYAQRYQLSMRTPRDNMKIVTHGTLAYRL